MFQVSGGTAKIDSGQGTAGQLINDPKLYQSLVDTARDGMAVQRAAGAEAGEDEEIECALQTIVRMFAHRHLSQLWERTVLP